MGMKMTELETKFKQLWEEFLKGKDKTYALDKFDEMTEKMLEQIANDLTGE